MISDTEMEKKLRSAKSTIYKNGEVITPKHTSYKLHTICAVNQVLAYELNKILPEGPDKKRILDMVDIGYDMGKRMGARLAWYHKKYNIQSTWRPTPKHMREND